PTRMPSVWNGRVWATEENATDASLNAHSAERLFLLTRFLHANRCPLRSKTLRSRPRLSGAVDAVFEAGELLGADRPARVELAGGNADLGAEAELAAVGKLRRGIVEHDSGFAFLEESLRGRIVFGHDRIGVVRAVILDMRYRPVDAVDHA